MLFHVLFSQSFDNGISNLIANLIVRLVRKIPDYYAQSESKIEGCGLLVSCGKLFHPADNCVRHVNI